MNKEVRMNNTAYYEYINVNPKDKYCGDCVIRAIALATGKSWEKVVRELTELGIKKGMVVNDKKLYPLYLKSLGFIEKNEPRDLDNKKMTTKEWLKDSLLSQRDDVSIVANVGTHHVTCIKNGKVRDTWNSSNETIHKYWYIINREAPYEN